MTATHTESAIDPRTRYEEELIHQMDDIDTLIERLDNPAHRRIMINFRRHGLLEVSGRYDELLAADMTVRHPHYRIVENGQTIVFDGMEAVRGFYASLHESEMLVMWMKNPRMSVWDWGFSGETEFSQFIPGKQLGESAFSKLTGGKAAATQGSEYDPDGLYLVKRTQAFVWPYDADQKMIGEHVYEDPASRTVTQVDPGDVITGARAAQLLAPLIDTYSLKG